MRFPFRFSRRKGGGTPVLDAALTAPALLSDRGADNVFSYRVSNAAGYPVHRLAIAYNYKGVTAAPHPDLSCVLYVWDTLTEKWYSISAVAGTALKEGQVVYFDTIGLSEPSPTKTADGSSQSVDIFVEVWDPGTVHAGESEIAVGAVLPRIGI